jgi:hypothetical protein
MVRYCNITTGTPTKAPRTDEGYVFGRPDFAVSVRDGGGSGGGASTPRRLLQATSRHQLMVRSWPTVVEVANTPV